MNSKGQVFSLDLILGFALTILAIGLLFKHAELMNYLQKDNTLQAELFRVGMNASNLLVANPELNCRLDSSAMIDYLPNCLPTSNSGIARLTRQNLGIPSNYNCALEIDGVLVSGGDCTSMPLAEEPNVFSIDRKVVSLGSDAISKSDFDKCVNALAGCPLSSATVNLKVWKQ